MKKIVLSMATIMTMGSFGFAGGDIVPVSALIVEEVDSSALDADAFTIGMNYLFLSFLFE